MPDISLCASFECEKKDTLKKRPTMSMENAHTTDKEEHLC